MAAYLDATKIGGQIRQQVIEGEVRQQAVRRRGVFPRVIWITGLVGALLMCRSLYKIPNIEAGYPFLMDHEILFSFAAGIIIAILLNLFILLTVLMNSINLRQLIRAEFPSEESIDLYFSRTNRIGAWMNSANIWIYMLSMLCFVYVFVVGVFSTFMPYRDVTFGKYGGGSAGRMGNIAMCVTVLIKIMIDGFPEGLLR